MKKIISFIFAFALFNVSIAVTPGIDGSRPLKATEIMIPIGKTGKQISLAEFSKLKPDEYEKIAQVKLNFFDRIAYKMAIKKLRKGIAPDDTIKNKKIAKMFSTDGETGFHLGGFALGFFLGLIGVIITYVMNDEKKSNRVKWAWLGLLGSIVILGIMILTILKIAY